MTIGERIKARRIELNLSAEEVARKIGKDRSTVYRYESNDIVKLPTTVLEPLARALNTTPAALMGYGDDKGAFPPISSTKVEGKGPVQKSNRIPVLGRVAAGIPFEAIQEIEDYEYIRESEGDPREYFALKIQGHSMEPRIWNGDIVIVHKQSDVDNGQIAVVLVDGEDATVKQIKKSDSGITLIGFNPSVYPPHFYTAEEVEKLPVRIVGLVKEVRGAL